MGDSVLDLYCGTGSIGIYLSVLAKKITGIEIVREAIRDAKDNAKINKIGNVEFICSDISKLNNSAIQQFSNQIIILDPPRAGLDKILVKKLSNLNFKRLIYVSCNPATFARDIKLFEKRGLKLIKVQPIDMFPQTHHLECVGVIHR
jgi:23S rRNA (uracil1939-C5)-methyltransferase